MPNANCHIQYQSCLLIGVPLDEACEIVTSVPSIVNSGFTEVTGEVEREDATDYTAKNFGGKRCGPELRGQRRDKWMNIAGSACLVNWGLQSATTGNPLVLDEDGNTIGYQELVTADESACDTTSVPRMALAVIRKAATGDGGCVAPAADTGAQALVLHVFPNTYDWKWGGSQFKDERELRALEATGFSNPGIGAGPFNLWPATAVPNKISPSAFHAEVFIPATGIPAEGCDPVVHPAPAVRV